MTNLESRVKLPPVDQIGVIVKDMDKAIAFYESTFGWGPFVVMEAPIEEFIFKGKIGNCRLKMAFADMGGIEMELIQFLEGDETPHSEFLREKGEGLQHLRCCVDDVDAVVAELAKDGMEAIFYKEVAGMGKMFAYVNTDKVGGVMLELINSRLKAATARRG